MISRATNSVSGLNDSRFSNVMRRVEAFAMPSFPPVRNFFVLRVFPRERETFSPRMAKLAVKHLVGDVSFLQDNANRELARFVLLVVLVLDSSSWFRGRSGSWSRCAILESSRLSHEPPLTPSLSPSDGERVAEEPKVG
ncbi:MAG: hypothetical protein DME24_24015 [Verrucomicrobia bacterium]|nr:MAG: hypothetical protein DME24_24015 [Verrucomicrobiota bacterium]